MLDPTRLNDQKQLKDINLRIIKHKDEMQTIMRLYSINPYQFSTVRTEDIGWRQYKGEISSSDSGISEELLRSAYQVLINGFNQLQGVRRDLGYMRNGTEKEGGLDKLKSMSLNVVSLLTQHDNPTVHLRGDPYNLQYNDDGNVKSYPHYSIRINPSWIRKVAKLNLSVQDIAGREAMVLDADPLPDTPEGYEAYATKVVTIRRPLSTNKQIEVARRWEINNLEANKGSLVKKYSRNFIHPAFITYETRYVVRTMTTNGWSSCTGTTVNWAASTLKRRMKTLMLKKLSV